jgi:hypothetical protein
MNDPSAKWEIMAYSVCIQPSFSKGDDATHKQSSPRKIDPEILTRRTSKEKVTLHCMHADTLLSGTHVGLPCFIFVFVPCCYVSLSQITIKPQLLEPSSDKGPAKSVMIPVILLLRISCGIRSLAEPIPPIFTPQASPAFDSSGVGYRTCKLHKGKSPEWAKIQLRLQIH